MAKVEQKEQCQHNGEHIPIGQNVVPLAGELLVIMSTMCADCKEWLIRTHSIGLAQPPIVTPKKEIIT